MTPEGSLGAFPVTAQPGHLEFLKGTPFLRETPSWPTPRSRLSIVTHLTRDADTSGGAASGRWLQPSLQKTLNQAAPGATCEVACVLETFCGSARAEGVLCLL